MYCFLSSFIFIFTILLSLILLVRSGHVEALLALKSSVDPFESLQWKGTNVCAWKGIKECLNERVTKLVLEHLNLSGSLDEQSLNRLDQFRVLSFKTNSISGQIPDLSSLVNLKSLFLNESNFRRIPRIGSPVEFQLLYSNSDELKGTIPPLNQTGLRFFNVSNNQLHGQISVTQDLVRFNISSFSGKIDLCVKQIENPCRIISFGPTMSPIYPDGSSKNLKKHPDSIKIIIGSVVGGFSLLIICVVWMRFISKRERERERVLKANGLLMWKGWDGMEWNEGSRQRVSGDMGSNI
ncbi:hypothetical protein V6N13_038879 [Hibiscus sabdariffa]